MPTPLPPPPTIGNDVQYQKESTYEKLDALRKERGRLLEENRMLSVKSSGFFNANVINEYPEKCKMLVGVSFPVLEKLFKYLCSDIKVAGTRPACATMEDQIIITLLKLKHNVSFDMLGYMNNINQSAAANYF